MRLELSQTETLIPDDILDDIAMLLSQGTASPDPRSPNRDR